MKSRLRLISFVSAILLVFIFTAITFSYLGRKINNENDNIDRKLLDITYQLSVIPRYVKYVFDFSNQTIIQKDFKNYNNTIVDINNSKNNIFIDSGYLLVGSYSKKFNQNTVKLIDLKTGNVIKEWVPYIDKLKDIVRGNYNHLNFKATYSDEKYFSVVHPYIDRQGNIYFHSTGPLIKMTNTGTLAVVNDECFHHLFTIDSQGNKWTCIYSKTSNFYKENNKHFPINDEILCLNFNDSIVFRKNIYKMFEENGLQAILLGTEPLNEDPIHLNSCIRAEQTTEYWQQGDLLLSLRNKSMIVLYRPTTNKIIWYKIGPWLNQHSPVFISNEEIECLSNNYIRGSRQKFPNSVIRYNFKKDSAYTVLKVDMDKSTNVAGMIHRLDENTIIVDETNNGAISIYHKNKLKCTLVNQISQNKYGLFFWSRYYSKNQLPKF